MGSDDRCRTTPTGGHAAPGGREPRERAEGAGLAALAAVDHPDRRRDSGPDAHADGLAEADRQADPEANRQAKGHAQADQEAVTVRPRPTRSRPPAGRGGDEVSALDKRIIEHLQADGRRPFTQIAADLGVSEAAIRARTNRLIERGILQVVGVTDPLKLGFHQMAMIGIRCESAKLIEVAEQLAAMPEV